MVLLPLLYMALIVLAAWLVLLHLRYDTGIIGGSGQAGLIRLILYIGPAIAGGILVFFMIKPFFAPKQKGADPITLDPDKEPLLFAFVQKICSLVGAPMPRRIDVDCEVNASASLRHGLWSRALVLTIGLPLVSGLDMRQFAGVLAHEFGHFAQGAGMRLTYIIRKINFWFARVVYERDEWDLKLERSARGTDWRIAMVLHMARGCVWLTRRILWALMQAGHAISCFMLRQMEYDADSYEAKLAGSHAFESTSSRIRLLNVATQIAYNDVRQSWASHRLPENLPFLIGHKASGLPADIQQKVATAEEEAKTRWFDTHPCDADRIRAARRLSESGVFALTEPAAGLFSDFPDLSKTVTRHQYEKRFELEFTDKNLMPVEEIIRESAASAEAGAMVSKFYGKVSITLKPLLDSTDLFPISESDTQIALAGWRQVCESAESLREDAEKISAECLEHHNRVTQLISARSLANAGFKLDAKAFGLPENRTTPGDQEIAARFAQEESSKALSECLTKLDPFMDALRERVAMALRFWKGGQHSDSAPRREGENLVRLLHALGAELPRLHEIDSNMAAFAALVQNRANQPNVAEMDKAMWEAASVVRALVGSLQEKLRLFTYPFSHAQGELTIAEYAKASKPGDPELQQVYEDGAAHVDRLLALHFRVLGRVLAIADQAEGALGAEESK